LGQEENTHDRKPGQHVGEDVETAAFLLLILALGSKGDALQGHDRREEESFEAPELVVEPGAEVGNREIGGEFLLAADMISTVVLS
jgi:hypothetical protein